MGLGGSTESPEKDASALYYPGLARFRRIFDPHQCRVLLFVCIVLTLPQWSKRVASSASRWPSQQGTALELRYGKIGIAAVAAAAPYQSGKKTCVRLPWPNPSRRGNVGDR